MSWRNNIRKTKKIADEPPLNKEGFWQRKNYYEDMKIGKGTTSKTGREKLREKTVRK